MGSSRSTLLLLLALAFSSALASAPTAEVACPEQSYDVGSPFTPGKLQWTRQNPLPKSTEVKFIEVSFGPNGRKETERRVRPRVGVRLNDGWLLGHDQGEWGGALVYKSGELEEELVSQNVRDIHLMPFGYVVLTGLSHLGHSNGAIYVISGDEPEFEAEKLFQLPSSPYRSMQLDAQRLLIETREDGFYLLDETAAVRKADCK